MSDENDQVLLISHLTEHVKQLVRIPIEMNEIKIIATHTET